MSCTALRELLIGEMGQEDANRVSDLHLQGLINKGYTDHETLKDATCEGLPMCHNVPVSAARFTVPKKLGFRHKGSPLREWAEFAAKLDFCCICCRFCFCITISTGLVRQKVQPLQLPNWRT